MLVDVQPLLVQQDTARQRQTIAVDAGAGQSDQHIIGANILTYQDAVQRYSAHARRRQIEAIAVAHSLDHLGDLRQLPAGNGDVRLLRPLVQPLAQFLQETCLWHLHRQIIDQGQRSGADAQDIVGVHRHAVDADGVVLIHQLRHQEL